VEAEARALEAGLEAVAGCALRLVLLHYAPTAETLHGEARHLWGFLGSERLAGPIRDHRPDAVVHAHAHAGSFRGSVGDVPVYNVSAPLLGRRLCVLEVGG
jgi:Icc-related predicted phosphoesterase